MGKYGFTVLTIVLLLMAAQSCRERNPNEAEDKLQEIEQRKQQEMDRYEEWSGTDEREEPRDSTDVARDSINRDSI